MPRQTLRAAGCVEVGEVAFLRYHMLHVTLGFGGHPPSRPAVVGILGVTHDTSSAPPGTLAISLG